MPIIPKNINSVMCSNKLMHVSQVLGALRMTIAVDFTLAFKSSEISANA